MNNQERITFGKQWRDGSRQNLDPTKLAKIQNYENELHELISALEKSSSITQFIEKFKKGEMADLFNKITVILFDNYPSQNMDGVMHNLKITGLIAVKNNQDAISIYATESHIIIYNESTNKEVKFDLPEIESALK